MASAGRRSRHGTFSRRSASSSDQGLVELASGLRGISQLAGNRAMIAMLARKEGEAESEDGGLEETLAELRLLLDDAHDLADAKPEQVRRHLRRLLAALHGALDPIAGYDGGLDWEYERVSRVRDDRMAAMLQVVAKYGEKIHAELARQLDSEDEPRIRQDLLARLRTGLREATKKKRPARAGLLKQL